MDVNKILEMLEREDKPFVQAKRPQVAKESLIKACNGDYDDINRLLEEDIAIDDKAYGTIRKTVKLSKESCEKKPVKECDATPVGVDNPIPSPVRKRADEEDLADKMLKTLDAAEEDIANSDNFEDKFRHLISEYKAKKGAKAISDIKKVLAELDDNAASESVTEESPMKGTTDDIVKGKALNLKKNTTFETQVAPETGKAGAMTEVQTQKAAGEELITTKDESVFPQDVEFDEEAFAELFGLDADDVSAMYVEEEDNIPEHIEIRFKEGENEVLLKLMDDGSLIEEVNAEIVEEPRFSASIEQDDEGNFVLLVSDATATVEPDVPMSEEDGEGHDEDGLDETKEFVEGAGLDLDSEYADSHGIKPAKDATTKIKDPAKLPVNN